jgi:hypothetical protein
MTDTVDLSNISSHSPDIFAQRELQKHGQADAGAVCGIIEAPEIMWDDCWEMSTITGFERDVRSLRTLLGVKHFDNCFRGFFCLDGRPHPRTWAEMTCSIGA